MGNRQTRPPLTQPKAARKLTRRVLKAAPRARSHGIEVRDLVAVVTGALDILAKHANRAHPDADYEIVLQAAVSLVALFGTAETQRFVRRSPHWVRDVMALAENSIGLLQQAS